MTAKKTTLDLALDGVRAEYEMARTKFAPMASPHEMIGILARSSSNWLSRCFVRNATLWPYGQ